MKVKADFKWVIRIIAVSIALSMAFSLVSEAALGEAGYVLAFIVLAVFIFIGVVFDIIGVAVTSAQEAPFHSMASHREKGAAESIKLLRNAEKVSSICNDVVGDICGIMSGATAAVIVGNIAKGLGWGSTLFQIIISGVVAGLTIGGKAIGKTVAMNNNVEIVLFVGRFIESFGRLFRRKKGRK